jgi:hypothetical protein
MKKLFAFLLTLLPLVSTARVDIAFLELHDRRGKLIQLEPNGRFGHVAISYHGQWLHSRPYYGVELVSLETLQKVGSLAAILTLPLENEPDEATVQKLLGKHFDAKYSWDDDSYYCSELIGKLLKLSPEPMSFQAPVWPPEFQSLNGKLGLSPDDIYRKLGEARQ